MCSKVYLLIVRETSHVRQRDGCRREYFLILDWGWGLAYSSGNRVGKLLPLSELFDCAFYYIADGLPSQRGMSLEPFQHFGLEGNRTGDTFSHKRSYMRC
jgi:hypothetical protein